MKNEDDSIFKGIIKVLEDTKDLHTLDTSEWVTIATLVSAIAHSNRIIRSMFYSETAKVAGILDKKQTELRKHAGDILRKYRKIWGDDELGEEICKLLDEDEEKSCVQNVDEQSPKKKVSN